MGKKRGNGEGSIYRRSDGRWAGVLDLGYVAGKRCRKSYYGRTRTEVAERLAAALRSNTDGVPVPGERQTVGQFLTHWLGERAMTGLRESTHRGYEAKIRVHILPSLSRTPLAKLTVQAVQTFLSDKLRSGLSPRTVLHLRAILRAALNDAVKWGLVTRNVAALADGPRAIHDEIDPFTPDEARRLLLAIRGDRLEALYTIALAVGLRQGEALGLKWGDIDLESGTVVVRNALDRHKGEFRLVEPKTKKSRRTLALPAIAITALKARRAAQAEERLAVGLDWQGSWDLVFTTPFGAPLHGSNVTRAFKSILKRAGLREQRFHDLRHACASLLIVQGTHPRVIMETLGHSRISTTMDTYGHVIPELQRDAANQMDALLASG